MTVEPISAAKNQGAAETALRLLLLLRETPNEWLKGKGIGLLYHSRSKKLILKALNFSMGFFLFSYSSSSFSSFGNLFSLWLSVVKAHLIEFKKKKKEKKAFTLDRR